MGKPEIQIICKSIFKDGKKNGNTQRFTALFAELINQTTSDKSFPKAGHLP